MKCNLLWLHRIFIDLNISKHKKVILTLDLISKISKIASHLHEHNQWDELWQHSNFISSPARYSLIPTWADLLLESLPLDKAISERKWLIIFFIMLYKLKIINPTVFCATDCWVLVLRIPQHHNVLICSPTDSIFQKNTLFYYIALFYQLDEKYSNSQLFSWVMRPSIIII